MSQKPSPIGEFQEDQFLFMDYSVALLGFWGEVGTLLRRSKDRIKRYSSEPCEDRVGHDIGEQMDNPERKESSDIPEVVMSQHIVSLFNNVDVGKISSRSKTSAPMENIKLSPKITSDGLEILLSDPNKIPVEWSGEMCLLV